MINPKLGYSDKTQKLIDKLCKIATRKSYVLKKKEAQETILKTYDLFDLKRPTKIVWYTHITKEFINSAFRASSASRASRAYRAYSAYSAYSALDYDFDYSVCNFEFIQNPEGLEITDNDKKYFEYSKLVIEAKELGLGYFCDFQDTLHLVPVPIIRCDEQRRYHSLTNPAISWKGGEQIYCINGVRFEKEWWDKIRKDKLSPDEVFAIDNVEHRRIAYEYMDKTKMKSLKDYKVLDERVDISGNKERIVSFTVQNMNEPLKFLNVTCPTGREYFLGTNQDTCEKAQKALIGLENEDVVFVKRW